jgi:hypothetical protein
VFAASFTVESFNGIFFCGAVYGEQVKLEDEAEALSGRVDLLARGCDRLCKAVIHQVRWESG